MAFRKLTPLTNADGERRFADAGVSQGERKPMFKCECGGKVVWVKSAKSGKNYLANCSPYGDLDAEYEKYWYAAYSPHFKTCSAETTQETSVNPDVNPSVERPAPDEEPF